MMVAGFRGTLYRSYEFRSPLARYECAMCEQQDLAIVGRIPGGGSHLLLAPRDPGQTNDGQFTNNRKNFLKLGLKWANGGKREKASLGALRIIPGIREGFILFRKTSPRRANMAFGPGLVLLLLSSYLWMKWSIIIFTANVVSANYCYCCNFCLLLSLQRQRWWITITRSDPSLYRTVWKPKKWNIFK